MTVDPDQMKLIITGGGGATGTLILKWLWDQFRKTEEIDPMKMAIRHINEKLVEIKALVQDVPVIRERVSQLESNQKTIFTRIDEQRRLVSKNNGIE